MAYSRHPLGLDRRSVQGKARRTVGDLAVLVLAGRLSGDGRGVMLWIGIIIGLVIGLLLGVVAVFLVLHAAFAGGDWWPH